MNGAEVDDRNGGVQIDGNDVLYDDAIVDSDIDLNEIEVEL